VERVIARSAAGFGVAFFLQSIGAIIDQAPNLSRVWLFVIVHALVASLLIAGVASIRGRALASSNALFPLVYLVALISWPFAVIDPEAAPSSSFWLYFLLTVATVMATLALPLLWATVYLFAMPVLYGIVRMTPAGGAVSFDLALLDSIYAILLGGFVTIVTTILRDAARTVDRAQSTALERYGHAVREHATEAERIQVDAIVHDSVLTTLLTAARAYTAESKALAATMAGNAIGFLRDAVAIGRDAEALVSGPALASRIAAAASKMSASIRIAAEDVRASSVPLTAAEALFSAAMQAVVNSLQHAGEDAARWISIRGDGSGAVAVEVGDSGPGFVLDDVPTERLGVRVSILERVTSAGGSAEIVSAPGEGTRVRLLWPDPRVASDVDGAPVADEPEEVAP
tara:strand:+ start:43045 stop:44247 length:1203 start_codon:yes stop_codon:yes gene_type:complete